MFFIILQYHIHADLYVIIIWQLANKIDVINTPKYQFHRHFEMFKVFLQNNYLPYNNIEEMLD